MQEEAQVIDIGEDDGGQGEFPVANLSVTETALAELKSKYTEVPDCRTKDGYELARTGLFELRTVRVRVEKRRKEFKRNVDETAKRIIGEIVSLETPLKDAKQVIDDEKAAERAEKKRMEEERRTLVMEKISVMRQVVNGAYGKAAAEIMAQIAITEAVQITAEEFAPFEEVAQAAKESTLELLFSMRARAVAQEKEEARLAQEKAELAAEKKRLADEKKAQEEEKAKLAAERAAIEAEKTVVALNKDIADADSQEDGKPHSDDLNGPVEENENQEFVWVDYSMTLGCSNANIKITPKDEIKVKDPEPIYSGSLYFNQDDADNETEEAYPCNNESNTTPAVIECWEISADNICVASAADEVEDSDRKEEAMAAMYAVLEIAMEKDVDLAEAILEAIVNSQIPYIEFVGK